MNIRKFFAPTSRDALRLVREALGTDAVVLSNRTVDGGVELVALAEDELDTLVEPRADALSPDEAAGTTPRAPSAPPGGQEAQVPADALHWPDEAPAPAAPAGALQPVSAAEGSAAWASAPAQAAQVRPDPVAQLPDWARATAAPELPDAPMTRPSAPVDAYAPDTLAFGSEPDDDFDDDVVWTQSSAPTPARVRADEAAVTLAAAATAPRAAAPAMARGHDTAGLASNAPDAAALLRQPQAEPAPRAWPAARSEPGTQQVAPPEILTTRAFQPLSTSGARAPRAPFHERAGVAPPALRPPAGLRQPERDPARAAARVLGLARPERRDDEPLGARPMPDLAVLRARTPPMTASLAAARGLGAPGETVRAASPVRGEAPVDTDQPGVDEARAVAPDLAATPARLAEALTSGVAPDPVHDAPEPDTTPSGTTARSAAPGATGPVLSYGSAFRVQASVTPVSASTVASLLAGKAQGGGVVQAASAAEAARDAHRIGADEVPADAQQTADSLNEGAAADARAAPAAAPTGKASADAVAPQAFTAAPPEHTPEPPTAGSEAPGSGPLDTPRQGSAPRGAVPSATPAGTFDAADMPAIDLGAAPSDLLDAAPAAAGGSRELVDQVLGEMRELYNTLGDRLAAANAQPKIDPVRAALTRTLLGAGFSPQLIRLLLDKMPTLPDVAQALGWVKATFERNLPVLDNEDALLGRGGVFALMGPTGVGKTTTTAKLAARAVMRHGADRVALLTTDSYRIGAHEQLRIYGRILGVAVHAVKDAADLSLALSELRNKHMVLIDTIGMSQRDRAVPEQVSMLCASHLPVQRLLLLNASSQGDTLREVVHAYGSREGAAQQSGLAGCIITKLDEANGVGAVLDTVMRHRLPVHYLSNGQKVPEDLQVAGRGTLVEQAFSPARLASLYQPDLGDIPTLLTQLGQRNASADEINHG